MEEEAYEKAMLAEQMKNNDDLIRRMDQENERKQEFIEGLKAQIRDKELTQMERQRLQEQIDRKTKNLLIDDSDQVAHRQAIKDCHKENLMNQLSDNERARFENDQMKHQEEMQYLEMQQQMLNKDLIREQREKDEKRKMFLNEIEKQLDDKRNGRMRENQMIDEENRRMYAKQQYDNDQYMNGMFKKKAEMKQYIEDL